MSWKPIHRPAAGALAGFALALLAWGCQPGATVTVGPRAAGTTTTTTTVSRFADDTTLSDAERRYRALIPLLRNVAEGQARTALPFTETASAVGVSESDLRLWYDLYDNLGRTGLITPSEPSVPDMAQQMAGTWTLEGRKMEGRDVPVTAETHIKIVDMSEDKATLEMLILEEGILVSGGSHSHGNDLPYKLGSLFQIQLTRGADNKVIVNVDLNGEVWGENYPGLEQPTPVHVLQNMLRLGETYTAVRAGDVMSPSREALEVIGTDAWNYVNGVDGLALSYGSFEFDAYDTNLKVSQQPLIAEPRQYWQQLRASSNRAMLSPQRTAEINRLAPQRRLRPSRR